MGLMIFKKKIRTKCRVRQGQRLAKYFFCRNFSWIRRVGRYLIGSRRFLEIKALGYWGQRLELELSIL